MIVLSTSGWSDYKLLDSGGGQRFEQFGKYKLIRPDPQIIWKSHLPKSEWEKADAVFEDEWISADVPDKWLMQYKDLSFYAKLTPFKHTGVFPEQCLQWDWMRAKIKSAKKHVNVLNLFGYTGIATLACAAEGAKVTHLDASHPAVSWARENQAASNLADKPIRWIIDDALKFTGREIKRGIKYDGILMDPPIYGHGPNGERWDFNKDFPDLLNNCRQILSDTPLFILVNAYAISSSALMLENVLQDITEGLGGQIECGELAIKEQSSDRLLSTGIFGRWEK